MPLKNVRADVTSNTVYNGGRAVRVRPAGAKLANVLCKADGAAVPMETLHRVLWPDAPFPRETNTLSVTVWKLRNTVNKIGLRVMNHWGEGYSMGQHP